MKKKLFFSTLCLILLLIMMLSTTLAWFTDSTSATNTMVVGKISIEQTENFVQDTIIMPNVPITKEVTVKNDGNLPCYARTLFAFEDKEIDDPNTAEVETLVGYLDLNDTNIWIPGVSDGSAKIQVTAADGTVYTIGYYIHDTKLDVNGGTYTCLNSVTLNGTAPNAWHEAAGLQYQIVVLSQATQVDGLTGSAAQVLDTVFGSISDNADDWFAPILTANN